MQLFYFRTWSDVLLRVQLEQLTLWLLLLMVTAPELSNIRGPSGALHTFSAVSQLSLNAHKGGFSQHVWLGTLSGAQNTSWKYLSIFADSAGSLKVWLWPRWDSSPIAES